MAYMGNGTPEGYYNDPWADQRRQQKQIEMQRVQAAEQAKADALLRSQARQQAVDDLEFKRQYKKEHPDEQGNSRFSEMFKILFPNGYGSMSVGNKGGQYRYNDLRASGGDYSRPNDSPGMYREGGVDYRRTGANNMQDVQSVPMQQPMTGQPRYNMYDPRMMQRKPQFQPFTKLGKMF